MTIPYVITGGLGDFGGGGGGGDATLANQTAILAAIQAIDDQIPANFADMAITPTTGIVTSTISGTITTLDDLSGGEGDTLASVQNVVVADTMQIQTDVTSILTDTGTTIPAQITLAFTEIKGSTWATTDTLEGIKDAIGAPGEGDATEANQLEIISKLSSAVISYTTPTNPVSLQIIRGDDYDGVAQSSLSWDMGKNVTGTCTLTIRSKFTDESLWSFTGTVALGVVTISLTSAQTTTLTAGTFDFDVQVQHSGGEIETISRGALTVIEDQTR